jgi:hypothetical protein
MSGVVRLTISSRPPVSTAMWRSRTTDLLVGVIVSPLGMRRFDDLAIEHAAGRTGLTTLTFRPRLGAISLA